ncbi:7TM diverse intracellular signaling domain-containing protein [Rhodanobacter aciditrophus]|uniref:7TM diverse intracellular signaling domain-containing protein n=1 Tax=Rhodanobacter aciditrophus TaxID=1623218 RepID=A0ABW4B5A9_9GAMM
MIRHFLSALILLALTMLTNTALGVPRMALVDDLHQHVNIGDVGSYYIDETGRMTLNDVDSDAILKRFIPLNDPFIQFGVVEGNVWLRVDIAQKVSQGHPTVLHIKAPRLQSIEIYAPTLSSQIIYSAMGEALPFSNRMIQYPDYIVPLPVNAPPVFTLYLKLSSRSPINLIAEIKTLSGLAVDTQVDTLITGFMFGVLLLLFISNIFFYVKTHHPMYLIYGAMLVCIVCLHSALHGLIFQLFPSYVGLQERIYNLSALGAAAIITYFSRLYLETKTYLPRIDRALLALGFFNIGLGVVFAFAPEQLSVKILSLCAFMTLAGLLCVSLYAIYKQVPYAWHYLVARLTLTVGHTAWILSLYGVSPNIIWFEWGLTVSFILEALIHFVGIITRLKPLLIGNAKSESIVDQQNDVLDDIAARLRRQTSMINAHQKSPDPQSQAHIKRAQSNLEYLSERIQVLNQVQLGSSPEQTNTSLNLQLLIDRAESNFRQLDQDRTDIELITHNATTWELYKNTPLISHLYFTILDEFKHFTDQTLTVTSSIQSNDREGSKTLNIVVRPITSTVQINDPNGLGMRYFNDVLDALEGEAELTGVGRNRTLSINLPIYARYIHPSELTQKTHTEEVSLVIVGQDSELLTHTQEYLTGKLFVMSHIDQVDDIHSLLRYRSKNTKLLVLLFDDQVNFGASDLSSFIRELQDDDHCLLISNTIKMSSKHARALGFDSYITHTQIESKLITELERLM